MSVLNSTTAIGVGFGTAALGGESLHVVIEALKAGFRKFDTAEADWWYDQKSVGRALQGFIGAEHDCATNQLEISTKIPPWRLTSVDDIRTHAADSRAELLGFCKDTTWYEMLEDEEIFVPYPLDVYYIHAPRCWKGWHPRCDNPPPTLNIYEAWKGMEAVVGTDRTAKRIGLSNVHADELRTIISWIKSRQEAGVTDGVAPPRLPDAIQAYADPINPAEELRQICEEHGIEFVSYSTLGTQHRNTNVNPVLTSPIVAGLAAKHQRSTAEVVLSWALQRNMSVIPRSRNNKHISQLARLLNHEVFLDDDDMAEIDSMSDLDREL